MSSWNIASCNPSPGRTMLAAAKPSRTASAIESRKKPSVAFHTLCICRCTRKLATPTAIDVNTSGISTIFSRSINSVPSSSAAYNPAWKVTDSSLSRDKPRPGKSPTNTPHKICVLSEIFFINVFYDLRCYVRIRTDTFKITRNDNGSNPVLEAECAPCMSAGGGWPKIVIINHFLLGVDEYGLKYTYP